MNNEWITDRPPTAEDAGPGGIVWTTYNGRVVPWSYDGVAEGTPWMPIVAPKPYVKPKRYRVEESDTEHGTLCIYDSRTGWCVAFYIYGQVHAERIAAIYEEMMP